jgi:AraC-like DNA-binding protein
LETAGIRPQTLQDGSALVGWGQFCAVLEAAARQCDAPDFGLDLALAQAEVLPSAAIPILIAQDGQSVQEWLETAACHWRIQTNGYHVRTLLTPDGGIVLRLEFPQHSFAPRQAMELTFATFCRLWRLIGAHDEAPAAVRFRHRSPAVAHRHLTVFGPGLSFAAPHYEIALSPAQAGARIVGLAAQKRALVDWLVRRQIETTAGYDLSMQSTVTMVVSAISGAGICNLDFVADCLDLSPKKLQRLLALEGTSFSAIVDTVRSRMALDLLTGSEVAVAQVAGLLDYAGTAPFSMAVRRWYGMSPIMVRRRPPLAHFQSEIADDGPAPATDR